MKQTNSISTKTSPSKASSRSWRPSLLPSPLLGIFLVFACPIIFAYFSYYFCTKGSLGVFTPKISSYGIRVTAPFKIARIAEMEMLPENIQKKQWQLLFLSPAVCKQNCQTRLDTLKRIHLALGKERERVMMDTVPLITASKMFSKLNFGEQTIVIVDPNGWVVMYYPVDQLLTKAVIEDLRKLLRFS